jgi:hypothetical protein
MPTQPETRAAADRARLELAARNANTEPLPTVTPEEWLDAHHEHMAAEDVHREVTAEHDLDEVVQQRAADTVAATDGRVVEADAATATAETDVADVRETAAGEEPVVESDELRVPTADETAGKIDQAQRALREIAARQAAEERHAAEEVQAAEMHRRHENDAGVAAELAADDGAVSGR